jgi:hypothetical protein
MPPGRRHPPNQEAGEGTDEVFRSQNLHSSKTDGYVFILNPDSWILKSPPFFVPSREKILIGMDWAHHHALTLKNG